MSDKPTLESLHADIAELRRDLVCSRSAATFWHLQTLALLAGPHADAVAAWVRSRIKEMKGWHPPEGSGISPADGDRALLAMMPEIEAIGEAIATDLEGDDRRANADEILRPPNPLADVLEAMVRQLEAQKWWLSQAFFLISSDRPGMMAGLMRRKLQTLKSRPPEGPEHVSASELEAEMLRDLPGVLAVGRDMIKTLETAQAVIDRKRSAAS